MRIKELNEVIITGNVPLQLGSWQARPGDVLFIRTPDMKYIEIEFSNYSTGRMDVWELIPYPGSSFKFGKSIFNLKDINWEECELVGLTKCVSYSSGNCWHDATYNIYYTETDNFYERTEPTEPEHHGSFCDRWSRYPLDEKDPRYDDIGLEKGYTYTSFHDSSD